LQDIKQMNGGVTFQQYFDCAWCSRNELTSIMLLVCSACCW
jgi:hypothetical protein